MNGRWVCPNLGETIYTAEKRADWPKWAEHIKAVAINSIYFYLGIVFVSLIWSYMSCGSKWINIKKLKLIIIINNLKNFIFYKIKFSLKYS